jgi:indole-3-glycerol phosphate synthase
MTIFHRDGRAIAPFYDIVNTAENFNPCILMEQPMQTAQMDFLARITARKKQQIDARRQRAPLAAIQTKALGRVDYRHFAASMSRPGPSGVNIIAEIKRASPSKGPLRPELDPAALACRYESAGAAALSVLTETDFFMGSDADLTAARQATCLPVLRKDFIFTDYQIWESAAMGADAVLLIVRILTDSQLSQALSLCRHVHLDALVEVSNQEELARATAAGARLIGINNRDLSSFATDTATAPGLSALLAADQIAVAASGIASPADIADGLTAGIFNFLVGEHLVKADDPAAALRRLLAAGSSGGADAPRL